MKFGVALSGGGLRGAAHIGFLQALASKKITPNIITGTSAGSIVAGMYALGISPSEMQNEIKRFSILSFRDLNVFGFLKYFSQVGISLFTPLKASSPLGLVRGNVLTKQLQMLFGNTRLSDLKIPFAAIATDIHTGEMIIFATPDVKIPKGKDVVVYTTAYLHEAVRASIAIPGIIEPLRFCGRYLVDGGLKANVPANVCRLMGADKVVAVDLGFQVQEEHLLHTIFEVLMQTIDIMGQEISDLVNERYADLVIRPNLPSNVSLTDFKLMTVCIEAGRKGANLSLQAIKELTY